jgi:hypothetical protein
MKSLITLILLLVVATSCNKENQHDRWIEGKWQSEVFNGDYVVYEFKTDGTMCFTEYYDNPNFTSEGSCDETYDLIDSNLIITIIGSSNTDTLNLVFKNKDLFTISNQFNSVDYTRIE